MFAVGVSSLDVNDNRLTRVDEVVVTIDKTTQCATSMEFSFHMRFSATALPIKFMQYFESFVVMPTIFVVSSLGIDFISKSCFYCLSI